MNACERNEMLVSSWLDGELDAVEGLELTDHLVRCSACRAFYLQARALDGLVAGVGSGEEPLPQHAWDRIREAAEHDQQRSRFAVPAWAMRLAAVLVLALGAVFFLSGDPRGASPVRADAEQDEIYVGLATDSQMSEARFVQLTTEVLRADRRFHQAMYEVMQQVVEDSRHAELSVMETERAEEDGAEIEGSRPLARDLV